MRALNGLDPENSEDEIEAGEEYIIHVPGIRPTPTRTTSKKKFMKPKVDDQSKKTNNIVTKSREKCENSCALQMMDPVMMVEAALSIHRASLAQTVQIVGLGQEKAAHLA